MQRCICYTCGETVRSANGGCGRRTGIRANGRLEISAVSRSPFFAPLDHEEKGTVFSSSADASDAGVRVQTGIGQRDLCRIPPQAANAMVTPLHGG